MASDQAIATIGVPTQTEIMIASKHLICLLLATVSVVGTSANGQDASKYTKRPLKAALCTTPPVIDGDLSDPAWQTASKATIFVDRTTSEAALEQTIALICFDSKYIYVAFDCHDSQPDAVSARETIRDSKYAGLQNGDSPNKEDNVTFSIDPNFTKKTGDLSVFSVNALGTPSASIAGGRGNKLEWKGQWISAAKRTPTGYSVEMRIPWEMLNYPSTSKPVEIGINFHRYQYRTKLESLWSNVTTHSFTDLEGVWQEVQVPQAKFKPKVSILPYFLGGISDSSLTGKVGADARMTVTPNLTAVATLNPDFGTVEGAVESISFSRSERFVPDRRPFFLEGENYFAPGTRFNDVGAYFYSDRIKTFDVGTKLYGKINPSDSIGFLSTATFGGRVDSVIRYKHDLSETSDVGCFFGQKSDVGDHNAVGLIDQHARFGPYAVESQFAKSWGDAPGGGAVVLSGFYQKGNNTSMLQYHSISSLFRPSDGYIPYFGYHGFLGFTDYNGTYKTGQFNTYDYGVYGVESDHQDGSRYKRGISSFANFVTKSDWLYSLQQDYNAEGGTIDSTVNLQATMGQSNRFRKFGLSLVSGRFQSQPATFIAPTASIRLFKKVDIAYSGSLFHFQGSTQQHILTTSFDLTPTRSFGGRLVAQDAKTNWYAYFRESGGKGTNIYVILGDPNAQKFKRTLQVKFVFSI